MGKVMSGFQAVWRVNENQRDRAVGDDVTPCPQRKGQGWRGWGCMIAGAHRCNSACFQLKFKRVKEVIGVASLPGILVYLGDGAFAWRGSVWRESLWSKTKASAGLGWTYRYCW